MEQRTVTRDYSGRTTVAGLFRDSARAQEAILALGDAGFTADQIGVAVRDPAVEARMTEESGTQAVTGAVTGAVSGGLLGGLVGFLVGLGALAIPGIGPVVAGGILASAFGIAGGTAVAGAGIGAAAGGLVGALVGLGIPEEEAHHFEHGIREGRTLVTVRAENRALEALAILERYGADTGPGSVGTGGTTTAGAVAGGIAGGIAGAALAGPPGAVAGAALGGAAGAGAGHALGEASQQDRPAAGESEEWVIDEHGNRVPRRLQL
ncbi:MAG: hypothetical protein K6U89_03605 [Chloroflexi bacterium]|nr:hypothetical protein [Chloroflexota bacterium]